MPWKVDWPAHWKILGVTIEGAGKDHSVAGGSRDIAREICEKVFHYPEPINLPYEFFTLGGKKMSASKGLGLKARDLVNLLPADVGRFLFSRTDIRQEIDFDPIGTMAIPDLFDEYDRCWLAYIGESVEDLARTFEMAQIDTLPEKTKTFIPRFRDVVNYLQTSPDSIDQKFIAVKGIPLTENEKDILEERKNYAKIWLELYAPEEMKFQILDSSPQQSLDDEEKKYLKEIISLVEKGLGEDELQIELYELSKRLNIPAKKAFQSIYKVLIGKDHGPKAGVLIASNPRERIIQRLTQAIKS